jgi:hypothetical protein
LPPLFTSRAAVTLAADIFLIYQKAAEGVVRHGRQQTVADKML